jgi:PAS domain S-box-containing protein
MSDHAKGARDGRRKNPNQPGSSSRTEADVPPGIKEGIAAGGDGPVATGMIARVAGYDWSSTPLGPLADWPLNLRTAVDICLNTRFPMRVWWGPELINIYNDAYAVVLGDRHPGALGRSAPELWPDVWPTVYPQVEAVMQRGESRWNERFHLVMERNGAREDLWLTWSYSPIRDAAGAVQGMMCLATEETAQVLADRERRLLAAEREEILRTLDAERTNLAAVIQAAPAFIATLRGPGHIFELANEKYYDLIGHREVIGRSVHEALPEVEGQGFIQLLDDVYRTGEPFVGDEIPVMLTRGDVSELRVINFVYQALRGADGAVTGIFVHGVDVTARVRDREALEERESRFRQLADAMPQIVWSARPDGVLNYYNRRWFEYVHLPEDAGEEADWGQYVHPDDLPRVAQRWSECLRSGEPYSLEFRVRNGAGEYRRFLVRALPIRDDRNEIIRWFGTCTDIHDQRLEAERIEAEREQLLASERAARSESELQSRMKDEFLATLSHEIRTPLNAILGWSQIMKASANPKDIAKGLEVIERNARAQSQIIEDLLDMSRIISGKVRLDVQRLDLSAVVQSAVETARPTAEAKGIRLGSVIDPLHGVAVSGDANRLQQILWNLISNATKFTPKGGEVRVLLERVHSHLEISVIDTGEGMRPEFLPYLFDRFRQADASTTRRHGGLGLGLSIVKQLAELHGGSVSAKSSVGSGSTFVVSLPLLATRAESMPELESRHPTVSQGLTAASGNGEIAGVRVLVIDDQPDARELVKRLLEDCQAMVTATDSVNEALELVQTGKFDVLVSDIGMPGEDGYSLIRRVRLLGGDKGGDIPAIALTAYARAEDRVKAVAAGFSMHVAKPVELVELVTMVAGAAGRTGPPRS